MARSSFWLKFLTLFLFVGSVPLLAEEDLIPIGDPPSSRVWDRDGLLRTSPGTLGEISQKLIALKKDYDMDLFLIIHSDLIGEKPDSLAMRCQEKWLGSESDGLVLILSINEGTSGVLGRSRKLYEGHMLDKGLMPRIAQVDLQTIFQASIAKLRKEEDQVVRTQVFIETLVTQLRTLLSKQGDQKPVKEGMELMGWMGLAIIIIAVVIALLSKFILSAERRSRRTYRFPEFTVARRLKAANGGGKISKINYGNLNSPSSDGR